MDKSFVNSENEKISIRETCRNGFKGQHCLIIHDDEDQGETLAIMLLDTDTQNWLSEIIDQLQSNRNPNQTGCLPE